MILQLKNCCTYQPDIYSRYFFFHNYILSKFLQQPSAWLAEGNNTILESQKRLVNEKVKSKSMLPGKVWKRSICCKNQAGRSSSSLVVLPTVKSLVAPAKKVIVSCYTYTILSWCFIFINLLHVANSCRHVSNHAWAG